MNAPSRRNGVAVTHIVSGCESKLRYPNEMTAVAAGLHYMGKHQVEKLWRYQCKLCHGWHVTRSDNGDRFAIHTVETQA